MLRGCKGAVQELMNIWRKKSKKLGTALDNPIWIVGMWEIDEEKKGSRMPTEASQAGFKEYSRKGRWQIYFRGMEQKVLKVAQYCCDLVLNLSNL